PQQNSPVRKERSADKDLYYHMFVKAKVKNQRKTSNGPAQYYTQTDLRERYNETKGAFLGIVKMGTEDNKEKDENNIKKESGYWFSAKAGYRMKNKWNTDDYRGIVKHSKQKWEVQSQLRKSHSLARMTKKV
ncbi:MAG: hypothetical protein ACKPKO_01440, partial [Candidatus Fonsibacter sp.]